MLNKSLIYSDGCAITGYDKKIFTKWQKNFHNYKTIKFTKNVTENCYASYN